MSSFQQAISAAFEPVIRQQSNENIVQMSPEHEAALVFTIKLLEVPAAFPISYPATSGASVPCQENTSTRKLRRVRIDRDSLLANTSVRSIQLVPLGEAHVKVFVNLDTDIRRGYNFWDTYRPFIDSLLSSTWGKCRIRRFEKKTFVNLEKYRKGCTGDIEIHFQS